MSISPATKTAQWQLIINDLRTSGQSEKEWCLIQGISYSSLRYWIRKLKNADPTHDSEPIVFASLPNEPPLSFSPSTPVTIHFASATIEISGCCHLQLLESLFLLLKKYA